jgi:hypothetical protein
MLDQSLDLKERLARVIDSAPQETIVLFQTKREPAEPDVESASEWMTASQLARYWQLVNANGEPTTAGIMKWARRADNEYPLPHAYLGDLIRFRRDEVDRWAHAEAGRRRVQNEKRRLRIV